MKEELKLKQDVITGFSYSFSKSLLEELKRLKREGKFFINNGFCRTIVFYLAEQLKSEISLSFTGADADGLFKDAERFLAIFKKKKG